MDDAFLFAKAHGGEGEPVVWDRALERKVDRWLVPISFVCYTMQFLDKTLMNYASVMGLNEDLKLRGDQFNICISAFSIAFLVAEVPNGLILNRVPVAKWLAFSVIAWGVACAATAAATSYHTLLAARTVLGMFEAAIAPCLVLLSSQWYTRSEQAPRFCVWYCGLGAGQLVGGLLSFGFQHVSPQAPLAGWRVMFLAIGLATVVVGLAALVILPDTPMQARFLSTAERVAVIRHVQANQTGIRNTKFEARQLVELALDPQIWLLTLCTLLTALSAGIITTYSSTVIRNFGYSPRTAALLTTPSGLVSISTTLLVGFGIRRTSHRWLWLAACSAPAVLGGALLSFLPSTERAGLLAGIYMINAGTAPLAILYQWAAANCAGHTKRAAAPALLAAAFGVGNVVGPQTFRPRDAPRYIPAKIVVLVTQALSAAVAALLFRYYRWENGRRDKEEREHRELNDGRETEEVLWMNLTDRRNRTFRYVY